VFSRECRGGPSGRPRPPAPAQAGGHDSGQRSCAPLGETANGKKQPTAPVRDKPTYRQLTARILSEWTIRDLGGIAERVARACVRIGGRKGCQHLIGKHASADRSMRSHV